MARGDAWFQVRGTGIVYGFAWVYRGAPGFEAEAPYVFGLVELAEGPLIATRLVEFDEAALAIGIPVRVQYHDLDSGLTLPYFGPDLTAQSRADIGQPRVTPQ